MNKRVLFGMFLALMLVFSSCGMFFDTAAAPEGNLTLSFGGSGNRALEGGPPAELPKFSSVTVMVKQNGKIITSKVFPGSRSTLALSVPQGRDFTVEVYGLVDHDSNNTKFGFCHSFSGLRENIEILEGKENKVEISLGMRESRLVQNSYNTSQGLKLSFWSGPRDPVPLATSGYIAASDFLFLINTAVFII